MSNRIYFGDNLPILQAMPAASVDLIYIDPPFNTGKVQGRTQVKTTRSAEGDRTGFGGQRYETIKVGARCYVDLFDDYLAFLEPRLVEAYRSSRPTAACTSTSTIAKYTTARCCWTRSSAETVS